MHRLRTLLFVPGDRPDRIPKALASGADCAVVDLEDAVAATQKQQARAGTVAGLSGLRPDGVLAGVRLNALDTGLLEDDLAALAPVWDRVDLVVLPMVPDRAAVETVAELLDTADAAAGAGRPTGIVPLVETAQGVLAAAGIATGPRVLTLTFGPADLSAQLGVTPSPDGPELLQARSQLVLAAAAAGLPAPVDGPWLDLQDDEGLARSAAHARALGFAGKQVLHPRQIEAVHRAFELDPALVEWAHAVDAAFSEAEERGVSSVQLADGTFVDYPVARRARAVLAQAGAR